MSKINERAGRPRPSLPPRMEHRRRDAMWRGPQLYLRSRVIATIIRDERYPDMWRVRLPNGTISDMANLSRAKDAALWLTI